MYRPILIASLFLLAACGSGKTTVENPAAATQRYTMATITVAPATVAVPPEVQQYTIDQVKRELFEENRFMPGQGITVELSFIQFEAGDRMKRWFAGMTGWGASSLSVRAIYRDMAGNEVGRIVAEGTINGGFFGGSQDEAVDNMAEEIAQYAETNFLLK